MRSQNPFVPAGEKPRKLKLFLYGHYGVGKTTLGLQFPGLCVLDPEDGSAQYGKQYNFKVAPARNIGEVYNAIQFLESGQHTFRTLMIDPLTKIWDMHQARWLDLFLRRNQNSVGHKEEYYTFQPQDWGPVKREWKTLLQRIINLPMNVIATSREKPLYAEGHLMKKIGVTFDCEKSAPYEFDIVARIAVQDGKRILFVEKQRASNRKMLLPQCTEAHIDVFRRFFDEEKCGSGDGKKTRTAQKT